MNWGNEYQDIGSSQPGCLRTISAASSGKTHLDTEVACGESPFKEKQRDQASASVPISGTHAMNATDGLSYVTELVTGGGLNL